MTAQPTIEAKKNILNLATGDALEAVGFITKDEVALVGAIQADLLAIRDAVKVDGKYDAAKLALLPTNDRGADLNPLIKDEAARKKLIADLGIAPEKIAAALAVTLARGSIQQDKEVFVPLATAIQEKMDLISPDVKRASVATQQFERLAREVARVNDQGADPEAAAKAFDLKTFDADSDISKEIQAIRRQINELEKNAPKGQKIDTAALVSSEKTLDAMEEIKKLHDQAISGEVNEAKIVALETYQLYAMETAVNNFKFAEPELLKGLKAARADALTPAVESTTIGAVVDAVKNIFSGMIKNIEGLFSNIIRLHPNSDAVFKEFETPPFSGLNETLSDIFRDNVKGRGLGFPIKNSMLEVSNKGSFTTSGGKNGAFEAVEAYAFAKSAFANSEIVKNGLHLQILNEGGASAKKPELCTPTDLKNLALCYVAVKSSGLTVKNEEQLLTETFKDKEYMLTEAQTALSEFMALTEMPDNPAFKEAKEQLDMITVENIGADWALEADKPKDEPEAPAAAA